jgi:hypothetical protein
MKCRYLFAVKGDLRLDLAFPFEANGLKYEFQRDKYGFLTGINVTLVATPLSVATNRRDYDHIVNLIRDKEDLLEPCLMIRSLRSDSFVMREPWCA